MDRRTLERFMELVVEGVEELPATKRQRLTGACFARSSGDMPF
jgi:hypothetical protein